MARIFGVLLGLMGSMGMISSLSWASPPQSCEEWVGNCDSYLCRESVQNCGKEGYFIRFVLRYCSRISSELVANVTRSEKAWIAAAPACLQRSMEGFPLYWSCSRTEDAAIISHAACYVQTGFCSTSMSMRLRLFSMVYKELDDKRMVDAFMEIVKICELPNMKRYFSQPPEELIP